MAATTTTMLQLFTILSVTIIPLFLFPHSSAFSTDISAPDIEDGEDYFVDPQALRSNPKGPSKFQPKQIRKGARCDSVTNNICNEISVNNGTGLLHCCKNHCRNLLGDRNNCGSCGAKTSFGQLCCNGKPTDVAYNVDNCGKCGVKCASGLKCEYGTCGYA